jgi:hypothetical protein
LDKSFVLNCLNIDSFSSSERLCALIDSINVSFMSPLLKNSYSELALSIEKNEVNQILAFFDVDEISSFEALRKILGLTGHGLERHNLLMYLDSVTNKVKLFTHRDFFCSPNDVNMFENFEQELLHQEYVSLNKTRLEKHLLLENFVLSDKIRLMSYKKIVAFSKDLDSIFDVYNSIEDKHSNLLVEPMALFFSNSERKPGYRVSLFENVNHILESLKPYQKPKLEFSFCDKLFSMRIKPNCISEIGIYKTNLKSFKLRNAIVINQNTQSGIRDTIFYEEVDLFSLRFFDSIQNNGVFGQDIYFISGYVDSSYDDFYLFNYTLNERMSTSRVRCFCD